MGKKMEQILIAIVTEDMAYGAALGKGLMALDKHFLVRMVEKKEEWEKISAKPHDIVLWDLKEEFDTGDSGIVKLEKYKYGSVKRLRDQILFLYGQISGKRLFSPSKEGVRIFCFCSVQGGAGATSAALAVAQELKRFHGKKVLYLSFDQFEDTLEYMAIEEGKRTIGEYLYYLSKGSNLTSGLDVFLLSDCYGVEAFMPDKGRNPLRELDESQLSAFIESLAAADRYDYILADLGKDLGWRTLQLMEISHRIVWIENEGGDSGKRKRILDYLLFQLGREVEEKSYRAVNWYDYGEEGEKQGITLDLDKESFYCEDGLRRISIEKDFGSGIKRLVNQLT